MEMDAYALIPVDLEVRQDGEGRPVFAGRFPYGSLATRADRGRVRKERFEPGAFSFAINDANRRIDFLLGHKYDTPLASRQAGTLEIRDTATAVEFEATLPAVERQTSWQRDFVSAHEQGLIQGVSPGFTVPPPSAVRQAERLIPEDGNPGVMIRSISDAVLFEMSAVTRPSYLDTLLEHREDGPPAAYWRLDSEMLRWL